MMDAAFLSDLFMAFDMVVFEPTSDGEFSPVSALPPWFVTLAADSQTERQTWKLGERFPFLNNFLIDADYFWRQQGHGRLTSSPWSENDATGHVYPLEATAVRVNGRHVLGITRLGPVYAELQGVLQKARENRLEHYRLAQAEAALRQAETVREAMLAALKKSHDDLVAILNQLHLGTVMLDAQGRITFFNRACQSFLGEASESVIGRHWEEGSPFDKRDTAQLKAMLARPAHARSKLSVHLETSQGRHYWMEVDIHDDPRETQRKIIFFYDVTTVHDLRHLLDEKIQFHTLLGKSEAMLRLYQQIRDVAQVDTTVLIEGETGTGKELVARAVHATSHRHDEPFIAVNCAGLTESLLASQLFGHRRGAFTGAIADQQGLFDAANGGTLFLDEIGDMPLSIQTSLLRVLQEREIVRLGDTRPHKIDVRIVAATHRDLADEVSRGTFRADLFYRIRVARLQLPPLRQRRQDIPLLVSTFLAQSRAMTGKAVQEVSYKAMQLLLAYAWPGNVRELKSAMEFAVIHSHGQVLQVEDLPPEIRQTATVGLSLDSAPHDEQQRILAALEQARGSRTVAARLLGMSRATFYRRLANLDMSRQGS